MSHRQEDNYGYVATETIKRGMVIAFHPGDPVPDATVEEMGFLESGKAVRRSDWKGRQEDEPEETPVRGEMPPHLRDKVATDAKSADTGSETGTEKSVKSGGASRKSPPASKGSDS